MFTLGEMDVLGVFVDRVSATSLSSSVGEAQAFNIYRSAPSL